MGLAKTQVITQDRASNAQTIDGSLRFTGGSYLTRTFSSSGDRRTWTWSGWVKRGDIPTSNVAVSLFGAYSDSSNRDVIRVSGSNQDALEFQNGISADYDSSTTSALLRDTGWYHFVIAVDADQGTQTNRVKIYINGELQSKQTDLQLARDTITNHNVPHFIGARSTDGSASAHWDGHMSQVYFVDGQQLAPTEFGFTDPLTNTWRPKKYTGTYGTNGFYLPMDGKSPIGEDKSGTITPNNGTIWSHYLEDSTGEFQGSYPATKAFNGLTVAGETARASASNTTSIWAPPGGISYTTSVEVWTYYNGTVSMNGGSATNVVNLQDWTTIASGSGTLNYLTFVSSSSAVYLGGVRIDGHTLIDGQKGNSWTPVRFNGLDLPKATGAIPILKTNDSGSIAIGGLRTDKNTYTVTASGGKYYLDGVETPTLDLLRGGSYTFDYTGATSHPFYLSSLSDGKHNSKAYSVEFDGTTSSKYLSIADTADLRLGDGDWTIEEFVYIPAGTAMAGYWVNSLSIGAESNTEVGASIYHTRYDSNTGTDGGVSYIGPQNSYRLYGKKDTRGRWAHIAVSRASGIVRLFIDGALQDSIVDTTNYNGTTGSKIGVGNLSETNYLTGKVSNVRVVKGQALYTSSFTPPSTTLTTTSQGAIASNVKLLCCQDSDPTTATVIPSGSTISNTNSVAAVNDSPFLYDSNGEDGVNTATSNTTKITIPHWAADTLYYYCNTHSGMGSSINVTTDIFRADPYAWKCMFAMASDATDYSPEINVNSTASVFSDVHTTVPTILSNFYGSSKNMQEGGGFRIDWGLTTDAANAKHNWKTEDFTIECWHYTDGVDTSWKSFYRAYTYDSDQGVSGLSHYGIAETLLPYYRDGSSAGNFGQTGNEVPYKYWHHTVWLREGTENRMYVNGRLVKTFSDSRNWDNRGFEIGDIYTWGGGYQDARIYSGVAKYHDDFIVGSNFPAILSDSPSGVTNKSALTKVTDGSLYFDGASDYLSLADSDDFQIGTGDFTLEAWIFNNFTESDWQQIFSTRNTGGSGTGLWFGLKNSTRTPQIYANGSVLESSIDINLNTWNHLVYTRDSGTLKIFVNGILAGSVASTTDFSDNKGQVASEDGNFEFYGSISNLRFVKGTAVYTSNFTPPTEPLTAITNTKLLCCQSNTSANVVAASPGTFVNDGTNYSSNNQVTGSAGLVNADSIFNGWLRESGASVGGQGANVDLSSDNYILWTPTTGIPYSSKVEVYCYAPNGYGITTYYTFNGGTETSFVGGSANFNGNAWITVATGSGTINSIKIRLTRSPGSSNVQWYAVRVDGTVLINDYNGKAIARVGSPTPTNFTPFTTDIDVVRGQEGGYATMSPVSKQQSSGSGITLSHGNLRTTHTNSGNWERAHSTLSAGNGKYYCEFQIISRTTTTASTTENWAVGLRETDGSLFYSVLDGFEDLGDHVYWIDGGTAKIVSNQDRSSGSTTGIPTSLNYDVIGIAWEKTDTNLKVWFSRNGLFFNSGNPAAGLNPAVNHATTTRAIVPANAFYRYADSNPGIGEWNFGQKTFKYNPPNGFLPLNTANLRREDVTARPDKYFKAATYTGNGGTQLISGLGFQPDLVWVKCRSDAKWHALVDSVRGNNKTLYSNDTSQEISETHIPSFTSDGFTVSDIDTGTANENTFTYVGWSWKAGGNSNTFNVDGVGYASAAAAGLDGGSITPTGASVGTKNGFSIIKYSHTVDSYQTIAHGLSQAPQFILAKYLDGTTNWNVYHASGFGSGGGAETGRLQLNNLSDYSDEVDVWGDTAPTNSVWTVGGSTWQGSGDHISYLWHDVPGLQKFGSYVGNGNADGPFIELGFRPALVLRKCITQGISGYDWVMIDSARNTYNIANSKLYPNGAGEENVNSDSSDSGNNSSIDILSNGFKVRAGNGRMNGTGETYIYAAWAEAPSFNLYGAQANAR